MRIGVPKESRPGERLVAATPTTVAQLAKLGYEVVVERGAGEGANFPDAAFTDAGAVIADAPEVWASDVVTAVNAPADANIAALTPGATVVSMMAPAAHPELVAAFAERGVTAMASTLCRASPVPSRSTCSAPCPTSPGTAPSSRPPRSSAACSPAR